MMDHCAQLECVNLIEIHNGVSFEYGINGSCFPILTASPLNAQAL
jgi:hypothetical protein